jgi:hypothetical protein
VTHESTDEQPMPASATLAASETWSSVARYWMVRLADAVPYAAALWVISLHH